jgi:translation initiation factor 2B subunit (eIF-2B alpha/beta/delta family)
MADLLLMGVDQNHFICANMGVRHPRSILGLQKQHPKWSMVEKAYAYINDLREKMYHHDLQYEELLKELNEYETGVEHLHNQINSDLMKNVKILLAYCHSSMIEHFLESGYAPDAQIIISNIDYYTEFELFKAISQVVNKIYELQYIAQLNQL